jgi:DNA (cytosine-5)-methyltransferase 1
VRISALDVFAGIGGNHVATSMCRADIEVVAAIEQDRYARTSYESMFGKDLLIEALDLRSITRTSSELDHPGELSETEARFSKIRGILPAVDLVMAGLPCQPHSLMGKRRGMKDDRGTLFFDVSAIVAALQPSYVVLENVRAMRSVNGGLLFATILETFERLGYEYADWTLDAQDYGVPQVRRRLFIVASRKPLPSSDPPMIPESRRTYKSTWHLLEREVQDRYYLSDRILETVLKDQHKGYRRPADINRLVARPLTRTMHKMHRASQDNYYSDKFIQATTQPSGRLDKGKSQRDRIRRITPREAFRIQGFPENLTERAISSGVSDTQLYMQAGNAVPPPMVASLLNHIL